MTVCDLRPGSAVVLEQDEGGLGDPGDTAKVEADPVQGLEGGFEQRLGALGGTVDARDPRSPC